MSILLHAAVLYLIMGLLSLWLVWWVHDKAVKEDGMEPDSDLPYALLFAGIAWPISLPIMLYSLWYYREGRKS